MANRQFVDKIGARGGRIGRERNTIEGIASRLVVNQDGCHIWPHMKSDGYGRVQFGGRLHFVHRLLWECANGPVPPGLELDHLCRNRACSRMDHLEAVTKSINQQRGDMAAFRRSIAECPLGHPYDEENTYTDKMGRRSCKICVRAAKKRLYYRKKQAKHGPA